MFPLSITSRIAREVNFPFDVGHGHGCFGEGRGSFHLPETPPKENQEGRSLEQAVANEAKRKVVDLI
ncbi:MAG: hypothetical protein ACOH2E_06060 [Candidatus Paracaedibacter sp.]|jgi:hypothetical protein